jgi:hypothetical protein
MRELNVEVKLGVESSTWEIKHCSLSKRHYQRENAASRRRQLAKKYNHKQIHLALGTYHTYRTLLRICAREARHLIDDLDLCLSTDTYVGGRWGPVGI